METIYTQSLYGISPAIFAINKWEFFLYLLLSFVIGYLVHYFFSQQRDYVRAPRKKSSFYYNGSHATPYYPNTEPIIQNIPIQANKIEKNNIVKTPYTLVKENIISTKDDLKVIEGIGPKIENLLNTANIKTWKDLSHSSINKIQLILNQAGTGFSAHNPSTWPEQAHLAETGQWNRLKKFQSHLTRKIL